MAIKANMTTHDGIALTQAYCYIPTAYVKKFNGDWSIKTPEEVDSNGKITKEAVWEQGSSTWKLIYNVLIYIDADKRADRKEESYRIKNNHIDSFKIGYALDATDNPFKLAYADLKTNSSLSSVADA
tara:strand:- start:178 stop:558 length:381 start_codon:yes stop_codon:yes gene_type:complete